MLEYVNKLVSLKKNLLSPDEIMQYLQSTIKLVYKFYKKINWLNQSSTSRAFMFMLPPPSLIVDCRYCIISSGDNKFFLRLTNLFGLLAGFVIDVPIAILIYREYKELE